MDFLAQELRASFKSAQNYAFYTLCTNFKVFFSTPIREVPFFRIKSKIRYKPFNMLKNSFYKLVLGFHDQT
jgi:hypothetical protein